MERKTNMKAKFFLKLQLNSTIRKLSKEPQSIIELKEVIRDSIGVDAEEYCFFYRNQGTELISVIDDVDLQTCYVDARVKNKMGFKIILKKKDESIGEVTSFNETYGIKDFESDSDETEEWELAEGVQSEIGASSEKDILEESFQEIHGLLDSFAVTENGEEPIEGPVLEEVEEPADVVEEQLKSFKLVEKKEETLEESKEAFAKVDQSRGPQCFDLNEFPEIGLSLTDREMKQKVKKMVKRIKKKIRKVRKARDEVCKNEYFKKARKFLRKISRDAQDFLKV